MGPFYVTFIASAPNNEKLTICRSTRTIDSPNIRNYCLSDSHSRQFTKVAIETANSQELPQLPVTTEWSNRR